MLLEITVCFLTVIAVALAILVVVMCNDLSKVKDYVNSKSVPTIKKDFRQIKKRCKGVVEGSIINIDLPIKYSNESDRIELSKMCFERNWHLVRIVSKSHVVVLFKGNSMDITISNIKLIMADCMYVTHIVLNLPIDFDYEELKSKLKDEHQLQITYIRKCKDYHKNELGVKMIKS